MSDAREQRVSLIRRNNPLSGKTPLAHLRSVTDPEPVVASHALFLLYLFLPT